MTAPGDVVFWRAVETIFSEAIALAPPARAAFVAARCGDRADLLGEVQSLLESHERATAFMRHIRPDDEADVRARGLGEGDSVGAFRVLTRIASGGMGTVYLAERAAGDFAQRVAVKVLATPLMREADARRFRTERQILASLRHPYIVTLIDGGVTPLGEPYLAMEFVDGQPITAHCREGALDLRARLVLFRQICDAVHYAHTHFVVHRDLKPANILVTADGVPKVLDFGVAKLLEPALAAGSERTEAGAGPLTPGYASPEQLRGLPLTTASDIYALGVVLYELLSGARPYETAGKPLDELLRLVVDVDAPRPSLAAPDPADRPPYDGRRALSGDLDAVVLKALRKDPTERYASADAMSKDIERYLNGRPVEARPPSRAYAARKLVARHKIAFASAGLSLAIAAAGLAAALWQAQVARAERDKARVEAAKARTATTFLGRIFQSANPVQARGQTVTARALLDAGTASITSELADQPDVQAALLIVMAQAYDRLGAGDIAMTVAQRALALRQRANAPPAETSEALFVVGSIYRRLGRPADAVPFLEQAVKTREAAFGSNDAELARDLSALALALDGVGRSDGVPDMLRRAIAIMERSAPKSAGLALLHNNLATVLHRRGDLPGARAAYEKSIAVYSASTEPDNWGIAMPLLNLGTLLREREDVEAARPLFERALDIDRKIFGPESAPTAYTLARLGDLARARGDLKRAHDLLDESLRVYSAARPPNHIDLVAPLTYLAQTELLEGRADAATARLERALAISEATHGPEHSAVADVLVDLAGARLALGDRKGAEADARRALAIQRKALSPTHASLVRTLTTLGRLLVEQHRGAEGRPYLTEAVTIAAAQLPERHSWRLEAEQALRTAR